ncbi:MAG: ClbS/DfsB family four-helix bundle protein [Bacilli bacterium]|nr:ClbS/DfsB family four-helix bundle protein [Bacilli bacterium]
MQAYNSKQDFINEINKQAELFINEFKQVQDKDLLIEGVDRTPAQMIAYNLGWMHLVLDWEEKESKGMQVVTPTENYKWNHLGDLYRDFYKEYEEYSLEELITAFLDTQTKIIKLVSAYSDIELFEQGQRQWASSTPSNWPIWKWIHINTVAPFKTFRAKIRKWKKLYEMQ